MNAIELAKQAGFERLGHTVNDWVCYPEDIETFVRLIEQHVLREWATEFAGLGEWACVHRIEEELKEKNT